MQAAAAVDTLTERVASTYQVCSSSASDVEDYHDYVTEEAGSRDLTASDMLLLSNLCGVVSSNVVARDMCYYDGSWDWRSRHWHGLLLEMNVC